MKKKYSIPIYFIVSVMILALSYYLIKQVDPDFINSLLGINTFESEDKTINNNFTSDNNIILSNGDSNNAYTVVSGYKKLTAANEKKLYQAIKSGAEKITDEKYKNSNYYQLEPITISGTSLSPAQIKKVIYAFQFDNPEFFWISMFLITSTAKIKQQLGLHLYFLNPKKKKPLKILTKKFPK